MDAAKDRIYAPLEDLRTLGVSEADYVKGPFTEAHRELMAFQVDRTWGLFRAGRALCDDGPLALRAWLKAVWLGGTGILEKIEARGWNVWSGRPALEAGDCLRALPKFIFWKKDRPPRPVPLPLKRERGPVRRWRTFGTGRKGPAPVGGRRSE